MSRPDFTILSERLLRGGVAPKHVHRYLRELSDHYDDVVAELSAAGTCSDAAANAARTRLGTDDDLVSEMLAKPELKSWGARWPWAVFGIGPVLAAIAIFVAYVLLLIGIMSGLKFFGLSPPRSEMWTNLHGPGRALLEIYAAIGKYALTPLIAVAAATLASRQRIAMRWALLGIVVLAIFGGGVDVGFVFPSVVGEQGSFQFGFGFAAPYPDPRGTWLRGMLNLLMVSPLLYRHYLIMTKAPA